MSDYYFDYSSEYSSDEESNDSWDDNVFMKAAIKAGIKRRASGILRNIVYHRNELPDDYNVQYLNYQERLRIEGDLLVKYMIREAIDTLNTFKERVANYVLEGCKEGSMWKILAESTMIKFEYQTFGWDYGVIRDSFTDSQLRMFPPYTVTDLWGIGEDRHIDYYTQQNVRGYSLNL